MEVLVAKVVEYERDWGKRPAGVLIAKDTDLFQAAASFIEGLGDFSCHYYVEPVTELPMSLLEGSVKTNIENLLCLWLAEEEVDKEVLDAIATRCG